MHCTLDSYRRLNREVRILKPLSDEGSVHTQMRFHLGETKRNISYTLAFSYRFQLSTLTLSKTMKTIGTWDCACVKVVGLEPMACDAFYVTISNVSVFTCPHLSTIERKRFQNGCVFKKDPLFTPFSEVSVLTAFSALVVWTISQNASKNMRFPTKRH